MWLFNKKAIPGIVPAAYIWARVLPSLTTARPPLRARTTIWEDMEYINAFVNTRLKFMTDQDGWGKEEYWATPEEIISKGYGDCEDFAILKWAGLIDMGYKLDHFCIPVVHDSKGAGHAVLAFTNTTSPLILDNVRSRVYRDVEADYSPVYAYGYRQNWRFE